MSDADFVNVAGSIDLFVIRASELAATRAQQLRYREVASRLIGAHRGTSQQLSFAGRRLNLLPSAIMRPDEQARLDRLMAASDFQSAYRQELTAAIRQQLSISRAYAQNGGSPTLKPVAAMVAKTGEADLRLLGYL